MNGDGEGGGWLRVVGAEGDPMNSIVEGERNLFVADFLVDPKFLRSVDGSIELEVDVDVGVGRVGDRDGDWDGASADGDGEGRGEGEADGDTRYCDCVLAESAIVGGDGCLLLDEIEGVNGGDEVLIGSDDESRCRVA